MIPLQSESIGPVRVLTLSRPEVLNALNTVEWTDLLRHLREAESDENVRSILIRAQGRMFCAGNDVKETSQFEDRSEARTYFLDLMVPALAALASSPLPVVAEAHGMALGAGLELLQFCDIVVAAESCRFQLPETKIGLWATVYLGSASYSANRRMTQYLSLTGEPITAQEAFEAQLVTKVVADEDLRTTGLKIATKIGQNGPEATAWSKKFANAAMVGEALPVVRAALSELIDHTLFDEEGREGVAAFMEKRPPHFSRVG